MGFDLLTIGTVLSYTIIGTLTYGNTYAYWDYRFGRLGDSIPHENMILSLLLSGFLWPVGYPTFIVAFGFDKLKPWSCGLKFKPSN